MFWLGLRCQWPAPVAEPNGWESDCKVAAEAKTYWRLACVVFVYSCPTLWQGPDPQANLFLSLKLQTHGTPVAFSCLFFRQLKRGKWLVYGLRRQVAAFPDATCRIELKRGRVRAVQGHLSVHRRQIPRKCRKTRVFAGNMNRQTSQTAWQPGHTNQQTGQMTWQWRYLSSQPRQTRRQMG